MHQHMKTIPDDLLAMLPVLVVFLVLQRNFIEALTMSGVKG